MRCFHFEPTRFRTFWLMQHGLLEILPRMPLASPRSALFTSVELLFDSIEGGIRPATNFEPR